MPVIHTLSVVIFFATASELSTRDRDLWSPKYLLSSSLQNKFVNFALGYI